MVRQHDQVGLVLFDRGVRERIPPCSGPGHLMNMLEHLESASTGGETSLAAPLHAIANSLKRRGLVVLISDLFGEREAVMNALQHFRHDRHEVIVFNVLDPAEIDFPFRGLIEFRDMETGRKMQLRAEVIRDEYRARLQEFLDGYRQDASQAGVDYQMVSTAAPYELMLAAYLRKRTMTR